MPVALVALALTAFAIGTTEFTAMGLLPQIAGGLHVSIPQAGWLISAYALGVMIGAPLLTAAATRFPRKAVLVGLAALFAFGNLLCAVSPNFWCLAVARLITGLPHGAFFGAAAVAAAELAAPRLRARAVSMVFAGLTVANIVGVPAATLLGQHLGWRATMLVVVAIAAAGTVAIARMIPHLPHHHSEGGGGLRRELSAFRSGQLWLALATVVFGCGGFFACYSYIAPLLTNVSGFAPGSVTLVLALYGVGMTLGNVLGGYLADRALRPSAVLMFLLLTGTLAAFAWTAHAEWSAALTVVALGAFGFAVVPLLQTLVMQHAQQAPTLASATVQGAFNLANAQGAYFGGAAIGAGLGWTSPTLVGSGLAAVGLLLALAIWLTDGRRPGSSRIVARARAREAARGAVVTKS